MKKATILILLVLGSSVIFGQKIKSVLKSPKNWIEEIIPFPIGFAPKIDLVGIEDLRFAPGWADSTSQEFWAYTFVWYVQKTDPMTQTKLTVYFNDYYDGLMQIKEQNERDYDKVNQLNKTNCSFTKSETGFRGKMIVYDNFFTKDYLTLHITVTESFCPKKNKQIIRCNITPKAFEHEVWGIFDQVKLKGKCK